MIIFMKIMVIMNSILRVVWFLFFNVDINGICCLVVGGVNLEIWGC